MGDMRAQLEELRQQAAEFEALATKATDCAKRQYFVRIAEHLRLGASEIEKALTKASSKE
jgi:hypothetical protein